MFPQQGNEHITKFEEVDQLDYVPKTKINTNSAKLQNLGCQSMGVCCVVQFQEISDCYLWGFWSDERQDGRFYWILLPLIS